MALDTAVGFLEVARQRDVKLHVTNLELTVVGQFGSHYRGRRAFPRADICWLEWRNDETGAETPHFVGGVYAVLRHGSACVLPYVNEDQGSEVIGRITGKFPFVGTQPDSLSPFARHFTTLHLDRPLTRSPCMEGAGLTPTRTSASAL